MPLQNRVSPFGELFASDARGIFMGNRGGRFHRGDRTLGTRRWASKQWICCVLDFKNRQRRVWGNSYTELFFLDEVTALAAGHRPCFECRRADANAFAEGWGRTTGQKPSAPQMDDVLHMQRLDGRNKRLLRMQLFDLPNGAMIARDGEAYAVKGDALLRWSPSGYEQRVLRRSAETVDVLTPLATVNVLTAGYQPHWHPTASA